MNDRNTHPVSDAVFRRVYDSPASLPGKQRWLTGDADVRQIEKLLGMPARTIGYSIFSKSQMRLFKAIVSLLQVSRLASPQRTFCASRSGLRSAR